MNNHKGFTIIEMLAVIIILGIILMIAFPSVTAIMKKITKDAFEHNAKIVLKQLIDTQMEDDTFNITAANKTTVADLKLSVDNYASVSIEVNNDIPTITIIGQNQWAGLTAVGTLDRMVVNTTNN